MERIASKMYLLPNVKDEYKKRHDELWPEMKAALKTHGAHNYSIFFDETADELFAYLEVDNKAAYQKIAETAICQEWWIAMKPLMKTKADNRPVETALEAVFYLE